MVVLSVQISGSLAVSLSLIPFLRNGWDRGGLWASVGVSVACVPTRVQSQPARQGEDASQGTQGHNSPSRNHCACGNSRTEPWH